MTYATQIPIDIDLTLNRIKSALARLGDPQNKMPPIIHVAGTNGKGSTLAFLRSVLEGEGRTVHVFTSPHLIRANERIVIGGQHISDADLERALIRVRQASLDQELSYFEELTAAAFLVFSEHSADFVLLEVGLGGRLDATNVVHPILSIITAISLDHQEYLGQTIAEITKEKAGIIKQDVPVICAQQEDKEANSIITCVAADRQARLIHPLPLSSDIRLGLLGGHQYDNAATAISAAGFLLGKKTQFLTHHLKNATWPGRLHRLSHYPDFWVDGAHNAAGVEALIVELKKWQDQSIEIVIGLSQLSNRSACMFDSILPFVKEIIHIDMEQGDRFLLPSKDMKKTMTINQALSYFAEPAYNNSRILFTGSLYMVGEILKAWEIRYGSSE